VFSANPDLISNIGIEFLKEWIKYSYLSKIIILDNSKKNLNLVG
jgi:hypothetical protein